MDARPRTELGVNARRVAVLANDAFATFVAVSWFTEQLDAPAEIVLVARALDVPTSLRVGARMPADASSSLPRRRPDPNSAASDDQAAPPQPYKRNGSMPSLQFGAASSSRSS